MSAWNLAAGAGICFVGSYIAYSYQVGKQQQDKLRQQPYVRKAMSLLDGYEPVMDKLGRPLKPHVISKNPLENKVDPKEGTAKLKIPLTGSNNLSAFLYVWATQEKSDDGKFLDWKVNQLDIELIESSKRWTFYLDEKNLKEKNIQPDQSEAVTNVNSLSDDL